MNLYTLSRNLDENIPLGQFIDRIHNNLSQNKADDSSVSPRNSTVFFYYVIVMFYDI